MCIFNNIDCIMINYSKETKLTCPKQYTIPSVPPIREPKVCPSKKYTPPLSILHLSHIPTAERTEIRATKTETNSFT